ncbi:MAG: hypothetical protein R3F61_10200 [Myxococcota bacterium]
MFTLIWNVAVAGPSVVVTTADEGSLRKRLNDDPADLVILYGGEQNGSLDTCGCPNNPRGSLARLVAYQEAAEEGSAPVITVNAGNWLRDTIGDDNRLRADAKVANAHMLDAVEEAGWSATNVSFRDLPYLADVGRFPKGAVLANARGPGGPPPYVLVEAGALTVAVTGVTHWSKEYLQPADFERTEPVPALEALLPELHDKADLVVVLGYALGSDAKAVAKLDIDVLVDADTHRQRYDPVVVGETVWVRSFYETQRLGELRLRVSDGAITSAHDRVIDLDRKIPSPGPWRVRARHAREDIAAVQGELFGTP